MKHKIILLLKDTLILRLVKIFLVILIIYLLAAIIVVRRWSYLPPQIPLFYSLPRSQDQLGSLGQLFLLPLFSLITFGINFIIASFLYPEEKGSSFILVTLGLIISSLFLISFIKILFLIF